MMEADLQANQSERPRFFEQQFLGAGDLTTVVDHARIARARHDLGAHSWGIVAGMQLVERPSGVGTDVFVQPGYAWDGFGRPITLLTPYRIPAELLRDITFDAAIDNGATPGRLVRVWLEYAETPVGGPPAGFRTCATDDEYSRTVETFRLFVGDKPAHADRHDPVDVAGRMVDAQTVLQALGSATDPLITDESVPYQTYPAEWGEATWLIPLGSVRWIPNVDPMVAGSFGQRTPSDLVTSDRQRLYAGVVAETVNAARGFIRMRARSAAYAPAVWSDDLVWCEGSLRVSGDVKLLGGKLVVRDQNNNDQGTPLTIGRIGNTLIPSGHDLTVQIGSAQSGANRLVVGPVLAGTTAPQNVLVVRDNATVGIGTPDPDRPLAIRGQGGAEELVSFEAADGTTVWHINAKFGGQSGLNIAESGIADGRLYLQAGGNVGINTTTPSNQLHVSGNTGIRQNRLYVSGGDGWSSLSYNAHHNGGNSAWVFPDNTHKAVTVEMDDAGGVPRFQVYSTTAAAPTTWVQRLAVNGDNGDVALAHNGGNVGIGTSAPTHKLHVDAVRGIRQNRLYMSGGADAGNARWSSISFNAHHNDANTAWVFPDPAQPAVTIEMDNFGGAPRFDVFSTTNGAPTAWVERFSLDGETGGINMAHNGGNVGVGVAGGTCRLHVADSKSGSASQIPNHVACIENTSGSSDADVLALRVNRSIVGSSNNFITFFAGASGVGAIEGNGLTGITLNTSSADYAEWMPRIDRGDTLEAGDLVGVFGGCVSRRTEGADSILVISTAPVILGNRPSVDLASNYEKVAMIGQAPVKVSGAVRAGDVIVATGRGDGIGIAKAPDAMTIDDYANAIGVAWESSEAAAVKLVRVGVGLPFAGAWRAVRDELARSRSSERRKSPRRAEREPTEKK